METTVSSSLGGNQGVWGDIPVLRSIDPIDFSENMNGIYITPNVVNLISKSTCVEFLIERAKKLIITNEQSNPGCFAIVTCTEINHDTHTVSPALELYGPEKLKLSTGSKYIHILKLTIPSKALPKEEQDAIKQVHGTNKQVHGITSSDSTYPS